MLHQPNSTFKPSQSAPSIAQPFDTERYLQRARELGVMVFPSIFSSGKRQLGFSAYPGYSFGQGHRKLAEEFDDHVAKAVIFDALCDDFDVCPTDPTFNEKVNAICHARCKESTDGDRRLIELCKRAKVALEKDLMAINLLCDLEERFGEVEPPRPTHTTADGRSTCEHLTAAEMREELHGIRKVNSKNVVDDYRARIARVIAYEKECERVSREIGLTRAKAAAAAASHRSIALITDIAELPATTLLGMAHKAALLSIWSKAGYGLSDETGEALAYAISDDARLLGTGGPVGGRSPSPGRTIAKQQPAQVH